MDDNHLTVGALARASGLSRSTLLYYDRLGLLRPSHRSPANYRLYDENDIDRLEQICQYRRMGIPLSEVRKILSDTGRSTSADILKRRLRTLQHEINDLRRQQRCIVDILKQKELTEEMEMISKDRWVAVMKAAGFSDDAMHNWHTQFEKMEPEGHQEFLESLGIEAQEVQRIRTWSREGK